MTAVRDDEKLPKLRVQAGAIPVSYGQVADAEPHFWAQVHRLLRDRGTTRVCDVGGGARPTVSLALLERYGLEYTVLDTAQEELERTPAGYRTFQASAIDAPRIAELVERDGPFDAVISRWAAEHIPDGRRFHEQVFSMLRPGGCAVHMFPTLYSPPFVLNRLLGARVSNAVLFRAFPNRKVKFPAYYSWCRGPSPRQLARLQAIGFSIEQYMGFFGHAFYARVKPLHRAQRALSSVLVEHPVAGMTSFALVVLERPA
jgi:SAM-dependent methyltransferase